MTQFPNPPAHATYEGSLQPAYPPRWSGIAIAGFVLSFLGCTLIAGLLGLILGIVGIFDTRGGRRRGMGMAIAAIPISLITGAFGGVIGYGTVVVMNVKGVVQPIIGTALKESNADNAIKALRRIATDDFNNNVDDVALKSWFAAVEQKHGKLVSLQENPALQPTPLPSKQFRVPIEGKFVNGTAPITFVVEVKGIRSQPVNDIEVDALSPRDKTKKDKGTGD